MSSSTRIPLRSGDTFPPVDVSRGMHDQPYSGVLIASGDYSAADPAAVEFGTLGVQSITIIVDVTAISGAGATVTINTEGYDWGRAGTAQGFFVGMSSLAITAVGTYAITLNPWVASGSGSPGGSLAAASVAVQNHIHREMRVRPVKSGTTTTLTYSVSIHTN